MKINVSMNKYYRTEKYIYVEEVQNILATFNNSVMLDTELILYYIDDEYKEFVKNMLEGR